ncbi:MAG: V-type ATP synthase subunit D [Planctomycetaceae bacterium]
MSLAINKTSLKQQRDQLAMYNRFLPSLDLKRQQLIADFQKAKSVIAATEREIAHLETENAELFALLGASEQDLSGLVTVASADFGEENVLGVRLPTLGNVTFRRQEYSMLAKPFWVDLLVELLESMARLSLRQHVEQQRVQRLNEAVRKITQRVNLFEKVLIPRAEENIQRIRIYLADAERTAVVRSKIAKAKRQQTAQSRRLG